MKPIVVLLVSFIVAILISKFAMGNWNIYFCGNLAMCIMLCFTAMGHFMFTKGMTMMMPEIIPLKKGFVYVTGIAEILLGLTLLAPAYRSFAAALLVLMFVLLLPANIQAAKKNVNIETAEFNGPGPGYLWFRVPLQVLFIAWVWYFSKQST